MGGGSGDSPCFSGLDGGEGEREIVDQKQRGAAFTGLRGGKNDRNSAYLVSTPVCACGVYNYK